jgi:hypothetical protein
MCTVTFIPREHGFILGMNRDERRERGRLSLPPAVEENAIFPRDGDGGTWIGVNASGIAFAILNRNGTKFPKTRSRGDVIPRLLASGNLSSASERLATSDLTGTLSFTLLILSAREQQVSEHVWDGKMLAAMHHVWAPRHWFSSGLSDQKATEHRSELVAAAATEGDHASLEWMRRLHRAHGNAPGPFSICVHRPEVGSVSYTEITAEPERITMAYCVGPPCQNASSQVIPLELPILAPSLEAETFGAAMIPIGRDRG